MIVTTRISSVDEVGTHWLEQGSLFSLCGALAGTHAVGAEHPRLTCAGCLQILTSRQRSASYVCAQTCAHCGRWHTCWWWSKGVQIPAAKLPPLAAVWTRAVRVCPQCSDWHRCPGATGISRRPPLGSWEQTPDGKECAYHAAGHAVAAMRLLAPYSNSGCPVKRVTIAPSGPATHPHELKTPAEPALRRLYHRAWIGVLIAGRVASDLAMPHRWRENLKGASVDYKRVKRRLPKAFPGIPREYFPSILRTLERDVRQELQAHWEAVDAIAAALQRKSSLRGKDVRAFTVIAMQRRRRRAKPRCRVAAARPRLPTHPYSIAVYDIRAQSAP